MIQAFHQLRTALAPCLLINKQTFKLKWSHSSRISTQGLLEVKTNEHFICLVITTRSSRISSFTERSSYRWGLERVPELPDVTTLQTLLPSGETLKLLTSGPGHLCVPFSVGKDVWVDEGMGQTDTPRNKYVCDHRDGKTQQNALDVWETSWLGETGSGNVEMTQKGG